MAWRLYFNKPNIANHPSPKLTVSNKRILSCEIINQWQLKNGNCQRSFGPKNSHDRTVIEHVKKRNGLTYILCGFDAIGRKIFQHFGSAVKSTTNLPIIRVGGILDILTGTLICFPDYNLEENATLRQYGRSVPGSDNFYIYAIH